MAKFFLVFNSIFWLISCCYGISRWDVFSTKTIYKWSHATSATIDENYSFPTGSKTCKAIHVNMVSRHGARWPSDGDMEDIKKLHQKIKQDKPPTVYPELDTWTSRYVESDEKQLTTEGKDEQQQLGTRTGMKFKTLFDNNGKYVKFVSSSKARTKDSNEYFHKGLAAKVMSVAEYNSEVSDKILRSYDDCDKYEETVESDENLEEFTKFSKTDIFKNIIDSVKTKLGVSFNMSGDDINLIYELCANEKAIFNEETVWCNLLTDEERLVAEYSSDIEKYYEASYGNLINRKISCPLLRNMFQTMDKAINSTWDYSNLGNVTSYGYVAGKFYNGHTGTVLPLMTSLELFKDNTALLSNNMVAMASRKFRTSSIITFSANLAFIVYACDDSVTNERSFMVKLYVNEKPISIPACRAETCAYSTVRQYYSDLIDNCNLEPVCDDDNDCEDGDETCDASRKDISIVLFSVAILYYIIL